MLSSMSSSMSSYVSSVSSSVSSAVWSSFVASCVPVPSDSSVSSVSCVSAVPLFSASWSSVSVSSVCVCFAEQSGRPHTRVFRVALLLHSLVPQSSLLLMPTVSVLLSDALSIPMTSKIGLFSPCPGTQNLDNKVDYRIRVSPAPRSSRLASVHLEDPSERTSGFFLALEPSTDHPKLGTCR